MTVAEVLSSIPGTLTRTIDATNICETPPMLICKPKQLVLVDIATLLTNVHVRRSAPVEFDYTPIFKCVARLPQVPNDMLKRQLNVCPVVLYFSESDEAFRLRIMHPIRPNRHHALTTTHATP